MTEMTGIEASTLHRLLEIGKINDDGLYKKSQDYQGAPIDADIVIVDEMSMVDMFLMNYLLQSVYLGTKLVLVGDSDQLASVGPGSVLKDMIESKRITTIHLDKIFRQAAKSKIIVKKFGNYDFFENIQILTPTKKGIIGTKELNKSLQNVLNPESDDKKERVTQSTIYRVGDRIMQVKNNYDIYWERKITNETGSGVFNGEFGTIMDIDEKEKNVEIKFDDEKTAWYQFTDLDQIEHSYSITIHKAQRK